MARNNKQSYTVGPGAASLLMIIVLLCLTVLGILALISARADYRLSARNRDMSVAYYQANAELQQALLKLDGVIAQAREAGTDDAAYLAQVEENLPEGFDIDEYTASYGADAGGNRLLTMTVEIAPLDDADRRYRVDSVMLSDETEWEELEPLNLFTMEDIED